MILQCQNILEMQSGKHVVFPQKSNAQRDSKQNDPFIRDIVGHCFDILKKVSLISDFSNKSSELDFFVCSLEDEMRKVDAFKRELPLCMQLLKDGIEKLKEEKLQCEERESGSVMEELMPAVENNSDGDGGANMSIDLSEKRNWLSSVQLWSTPVEYENNFDSTRNEQSFLSIKSGYEEEEVKNKGGAFSPFKKPSSLPLSVHEVESTVKDGSNRGAAKPRPQQQQRKQRRCWSPELHRLFVDALDNLGGSEVATPKQIREQMKVEGLTNDEVKSHLQKYRIHVRRVESSSPGPGEFGMVERIANGCKF